MVVKLLLVHISFFMTLWSLSAVVGVSSLRIVAKPGCPSYCADVEIPYPFGIGAGCHMPDTIKTNPFQVLCDNSTKYKPLLNLTYSLPEVVEISLSGTLKIRIPITFSNCSNKSNNNSVAPSLGETNMYFSTENRFTSVSCGRIVSLLNSSGFTEAACFSYCDSGYTVLRNSICGGVNCCQTTIAQSTKDFDIRFGPIIETQGDLGSTPAQNTCKYAFMVDPDWFTSSSTNTSAIPEMDDVPVLLDWRIYGMSNSTEDNLNRNCTSEYGPCSCAKGYEGNPYLLGGCQDINECDDPDLCPYGTICSNLNGTFECYYAIPRTLQPIRLVIIVLCSVFGLLLIVIGTWWLCKVVEKRKDIKRKEKFFRLNGGLLLQQQLSSGDVNTDKIKVFNAKELEKATDRFNVDRVLGEGGQGTVYKGMLADGRIVAVKKSKVIKGGEVNQFINEIVILSQINHRNVVKLFGCCLESEVPLLVYEFLPNGTLSQYIQSRDEDFPLTWEIRLRVATEVAGAISYLHSSASMSIYHRDIKSSNILLDDKYRAKVADFGTSRSVAINQTHLTMTHVNGTFGYLDPEYFRSSQFSEKSDVYSFGVVLAELLTGQKPVSVTRSPEGIEDARSLATYFTASMEDDCLFDILDAEVIQGGKKEEIIAVANLATCCLNMYGKNRPTMKEIVVQLEGILLTSKPRAMEQNNAEIGYLHSDSADAWGIVSTSTGSHMDTGNSLYELSVMSFKSL